MEMFIQNKWIQVLGFNTARIQGHDGRYKINVSILEEGYNKSEEENRVLY